MASDPTSGQRGVHDRPRLGEFLVEFGFITPEQLAIALREQSSWGGRLGQNLVHLGLIDEPTLAVAIADQLYLKLVDLELTPPPLEVVRLLPVSLAEHHGVIAVAVAHDQGKIAVACSDPANNSVMREVRRVTGLVPVPCVATASQIDRTVRRCYYGESDPEPSPDPHLHVTRGALPRERGDGNLASLERRIDRLLDLVEKNRS
jgi:hypothetical protein